MFRKAYSSIGRDGFSLLLISFMILFFELVCIRWISSTVSYIGLFSNVILLAAFLGIGMGCMLKDWRSDLINYFPHLVFLFVLLFSFGFFESTIYSRALYAKSDSPFDFIQGGLRLDPSMLLTVIFAFVTFIFITLSQDLGRLFGRFKPLEAYSINIVGSLAGIITFSAMSYMSLGPMWWFTLFYILLFTFKQVNGRNIIFNVNFLIFLPITLVSIYSISYGIGELIQTQSLNEMYSPQVYWSPYYRVEKAGNIIVVNKIGHQMIRTPPEMDTVQYPPRYLFNRTFDDVLIVGSGTGTDTAASLYFNNKRIDAVEIDPVIIDIGREYNPYHPYSNPKVTVINDDARSYLMKTNKKYDLIIYGLTDSITALSTYGSLRLESYLYTTEAFKEVKNHLKDDGLFATGNYYPNRQFADKLAIMLEQSFNQKPHIIILPPVGNGSQLLGEVQGVLTFSGPAVDKIEKRTTYEISSKVTPSTDDWPFFYIQNPSIPRIYADGIALIILFTLALFIALGLRGSISGINPHFFFLGAAFMLLETKSVINFSLIYGATWVVNSFVFVSVLLMVLAAVYFVGRHPTLDIRPWYLCLFILLALNYMVPLSAFLSPNPAIKYVLSAVFYFSPIFLANVIFSNSFKGTRESSIDYASNILGAVLGGITEYLSLVAGYRNLVIVIAVFYFIALARRRTD
ncbi:MAG: hypothetical protein V1744_02695 [Candidatus Altiarchaeota archaeon]